MIVTFQSGDTSVGVSIFLFMLLFGLFFILPIFRFQVDVFADRLEIQRAIRKETVMFQDIRGLGQYQTRIMSGNAIGINWLELLTDRGSRKLKIGQLSIDDAQALIQYLGSRIQSTNI